MAEDESVATLFSEAVQDTADLAQQEIALLKSEVGQSMSRLFVGAAMMIGAAVFAIAAVALFTEALVEWLARIVNSEALAALILGSAIALIGAGLALYGRSAFARFTLTPERTMRSLHEDAEVLSRRMPK